MGTTLMDIRSRIDKLDSLQRSLRSLDQPVMSGERIEISSAFSSGARESLLLTDSSEAGEVILNAVRNHYKESIKSELEKFEKEFNIKLENFID